MTASKEGRKPEVAQVVSDTIAWFEWARKERIVLAMSEGGFTRRQMKRWRCGR
ncbi:hypothetical protein [Nostoc sp. MG11]|uniref:hypothetical protein n=1 Tax=Nostoc sp. MG11 TaxID=2721166 RepID=UPI001866012F|nr:hypothetical protein [Nostoc sp. MG11]